MTRFLSRSQWIFVALFFLAALSLFYYTFFTANHFELEAPVQFEIKNNEPLSSIASRLESKNIIPNSFNFKVAAFVYGVEKKIRAARFRIPNDLSYFDLLDLFTKGEADFLRNVNILPGHTVHWIASRLKWSIFMDSTEFVNQTFDSLFTNQLAEKTNNLQGYLMSAQYNFYENSTPMEVIQTMIDSFKVFWRDSLDHIAKKNGFTRHEILTLASIVDGETNLKSEMPSIAGVYLNRLRIGMKLQADPTIQYLLNSKWRRLLNKDLKMDSPYNTYRYSGLPPGPINNPGKAAILACLFPDHHDYLYFVADTNGVHSFSKTYSEHLKKVNIYRKWLKKNLK